MTNDDTIYQMPKTHLHFCPSCGATWEHDNLGCDKPTQGVRCPDPCEKNARTAEASAVMFAR